MCSSAANGFSKNLFATNCIHELLNFTSDFWKSGILNQDAMSFILISSILQKNLPSLFLQKQKHRRRDRGEILHVAAQMYNCTQHTRKIRAPEKLHARCCCQAFCAQHLQPIPGARTRLCLLLKLRPTLSPAYSSALSVSDAAVPSFFSYLTALEKIKTI